MRLIQYDDLGLVFKLHNTTRIPFKVCSDIADYSDDDGINSFKDIVTQSSICTVLTLDTTSTHISLPFELEEKTLMSLNCFWETILLDGEGDCYHEYRVSFLRPQAKERYLLSLNQGIIHPIFKESMENKERAPKAPIGDNYSYAILDNAFTSSNNQTNDDILKFIKTFKCDVLVWFAVYFPEEQLHESRHFKRFQEAGYDVLFDGFINSDGNFHSMAFTLVPPYILHSLT